MNTPKNTKSEEIKQQVTKVGVMKDKKIDCTCKEHHKHECYFGKRPCDKCKGRNCTPQEQKSVGLTLLKLYTHCIGNSDLDEAKRMIDKTKSELTKLLTDELSTKYKLLLTSKELEEIYKANEGNVERSEIFEAMVKEVTDFNAGLDEAIKTIERKLSE